jgi:glycosyltransferase involved in cell wall biosynthesis/uncharacterized HAD superfamily protein
MFNYKTYYDLSRDIASGIQKLPSVDVVVGIPRSGIIPACMIAAFLNVPYYDLDTFLFMHVSRNGSRRVNGASMTAKAKALIVDDSVNTGTEMRRVRMKLASLASQFELLYCAIYAVDRNMLPEDVDLAFASLPHPRVFQWNYRSHIIAEHACYDMDGVLCEDPSDEQNDDGECYLNFIRTARPLFIPKKKISAIVTSRLEKYRAATSEWLERHGVKCGELIMLDLPSAEARRKAGAHGPFKAAVYRERSEILFVESNWKQAQHIAKNADKPVICTENDVLLMGAAHVSSQQARGDLFNPQVLDNQEMLRREVARLSEQLAQRELSGSAGSTASRPALKMERVATDPWIRARFVRNVISRTEPSASTKKPGPMRVLMICYSLDKKVGAGAAESSGRLAAALRKIGLDVHTLSKEDFPDFAVDNAGQPLSGALGGFWNSFHDPAHSRSLRQKIDAIAPDVIVLGAVDRGIISLADIAALGYPLVWINRDNWSHTGGCLFKLGDTVVPSPGAVDAKYLNALGCREYTRDCVKCKAIPDKEEASIARLQHGIKRLVYEARRDIVFAPISPWLARAMREATLTGGHEIRSVYNPIDLNLYRPLDKPKGELRAVLGLPQDGKLILMAAHSLDNVRKGVALIFKALADGNIPSHIKFVIIGHGGMSDIPNAIVERFISLGFIAEDQRKVELYNAVDATLLTTLQESLSVVASDSLCCGTPVIAFKTSGLAEIVSHKVTGYLAEPFDCAGLSEGINWLLAKTDTAKVAEAARQSAVEMFDELKNAKVYKTLFEEAISRYRRDSNPLVDTSLLEGMLESMQAILRHKRRAVRAAKKTVDDAKIVESGIVRPTEDIAERALGTDSMASRPLLEVANKHTRDGRYKEALELYQQLYKTRRLPIYKSNIEFVRARMNSEKQGL